MTELMPPVDDLLVSEEQDNNLTYFAFANPPNEKPNKAAAVTPQTKVRIGELPELLAGPYPIERLPRAGGTGAVSRARALLGERSGDPGPSTAVTGPSEEFAGTPHTTARP